MYTDLNDLRDDLEGFDADEASHYDRLALAQTLMRAAIDLAEEVADETDDDHAKAYWIDQARVLAGADHGFCDGSYNLDAWMANLDENEDD